ncbi:TetR/AcrR family transcriptional regulator [Pseudonocardia sp. TRM90224]|uniref:TetR/AcrR family transcriptional regulator n=1 Tax=Pseudonocardia sp. TRM90224 TaxID=2812678 RepID=UPI001E3E45FD|nr:TetR/AcrR family transcriptional regulator [Pseudonocardia sp. TRM90224]
MPHERMRADAQRNRRAILAATEELLATHRPEQVSMEAVAVAAGVGKGTVFHRFGSRMGLMVELMRERAQSLGDAVETGPPPLGPGAPPGERLLAFVDAVVGLVARNKGLLAALGHAATTTTVGHDDSHDAHPIYRAWHAHVAALIRAERPDLPADVVAHVLLAGLQSDPVLQLLSAGEGAQVASALRVLVVGLLEH